MKHVLTGVACAAALAFTAYAGAADDADDAEKIHIDTPAGWTGERIVLPPSFAPDLGLAGVEEIRFAPGMFKPGEEDFFSYVLVFQLTGEPKLTKEKIGKELLVYYRGLAKAVSRGAIAVDGFSIEVAAVESQKETAAKQYVATMKWVEPFKTKQAQTLRIEVRVWDRPKAGHTYMFMSVSPQGADHAIWKAMHGIRDAFVKRYDP